MPCAAEAPSYRRISLGAQAPEDSHGGRPSYGWFLWPSSIVSVDFLALRRRMNCTVTVILKY